MEKQIVNTGSGIHRTLLWLFNLIFGLLLLVWPISSGLGFFAYIARGPRDLIMEIAIWSIWTYPVTYLIALIGSILLYRKNHHKAGILFANLPIINIIVSLPFLYPYFKFVADGSIRSVLT